MNVENTSTGENPINVENIEHDDIVTIINMSSHKLSEGEISLLKNGLKFTPTPKTNITDLRADISVFNRKMRLAEFFKDTETQEYESIVKNKSKFTPKRNRDGHLDRFIDHLNTFPIESNDNIRSNLNRNQREAMRTLTNNSDIIIKESDKGSTVCVMDRDFYSSKILEILNDNQFYTEIDANMDSTTMCKINHLIRNHCDELTDDEQKYLVEFEVKTSNFYGLPKVHKSKNIIDSLNNASQNVVECKNPSDLKFRPIVAGPACPTHRLSNFIDILLRPYIKHVKSYVRDDIDFLNHLPKETDDDTVLCTFDVTSLYTNISHDLGIQAITYWLENYARNENNRISNEFIIDSVKLILENNTFQFDSRHFKQISGTAMGTKMAPTYATLVLGFLETKLYDIFKEKYGEEGEKYLIENFKRYLDDIFCLWNKRKFGNSSNLLEILNNLDPNIQFTHEEDPAKLSFLDVLVLIIENKISTDIFYKPTDSKSYLDFHSCHPKNTKINVPYNLARRICTICSDITTRDRRLSELQCVLQRKHYPLPMINAGIEKAKGHDILELRQTNVPTEDKNVVTFVHTYNPHHPNMFQEIHKSFTILEGSPDMKEIVQNTKFISSKKQPPNLKQILTKASFESRTGVVSKCPDKRCGSCEFLITGNTFLFHRANFNFTIKDNMNCGTQNLLYVLVCMGCNEYYVGQTGNSLRERNRVHKSQIKNVSIACCPASRHIHTCARNKYPQYRIMPFFKIHSANASLRDAKELYFINKTKALLNG